MIKNSLILIVAVYTVQQATAQSISLDFPHFAGDAWILRVFEGERLDTIASGGLNDMGKAQIAIPPKYKDYNGMSQWLLSKGGGVDMILSGGEDISISCPEPDPATSGIDFANTPQNTYLRERYAVQDKLLQRIEALRMLVDVYQTDRVADPLLPAFESELAKQEDAYTLMQQQTAISNTYAARFSEIVNITRGLGKTLAKDRLENGLQLSEFIVNEVDVDALYTSGHWVGVLNQWIGGALSQADSTADDRWLKDYEILKERLSTTQQKRSYAAMVSMILKNLQRDDLVFLTGCDVQGMLGK